MAPDPESPVGPLSLTTLGGAVLASPLGEELIGAGKPLAVLTYLASSPRRTASREHLLDLFWADLDPERARHALRQTVWYLRQVLGQRGLLAHGLDLTLRADLRLDRDSFLEAVDRGDLGRSVRIYGGPFLAGFAAPGSVEFEHWADVERQRLHAIFLRVAERQVRVWLSEGRFRDAQALARRARDSARQNEAAWRLLLEVHLASGEELGFALEANALSLMLAHEGRELEPATAALLAQSRERHAESGPRGPGDAGGGGAGSGAEPRPALVPALVGREVEFGAVIGAWGRVTRAHGEHLHVSAPPGYGKTRLLHDARRRLRSLGATVVSFRANPGDRGIPYSFLAELVRLLAELPGAAGVSPATAGVLVALNASLSARYSAPTDPATGDDALRRRSTALGELLATISEEHPLALLLDDLHWADALSRQALRPVLERIESCRVLVVTAARSIAGLDLVGQDTHRVILDPLGVSDVTELLVSLGRLPEERWAAELPSLLKTVTGGSPLLILEALQLAIDRNLLELVGNAWRSPAPVQLESELREGRALRSRIEALDQEGRWALLLLATAGTPLTLEQVGQSGESTPEAVETALLLLEQRGLAERAGEGWRPAHDEIAAQAVEAAPPEQRREAHAGLGRLFAGAGDRTLADLERGARHLAAAGLTGELQHAYLRYLRLARRVGDNRRLRHLASQFLRDRPPAEADALSSSLGRLNRLRYGAGRPAVALAVTLAVVALVGLGLVSWLERPDQVLFLWDRHEQANDAVVEVPLQQRDWDPDLPIDISHARNVGLPVQRDGIMDFTPAPDGKGWYYTQNVGGSATQDIFRSDARSDHALVAGGPGDDVNPGPGRGGRHLVFATARYSREDNYQLAVKDLGGGTVRQLTSDPGMHLFPSISPDGLEVVYSWRSGARSAICWKVMLLEARPACFENPPNQYTSLGWLDEETVLLLANPGDKGVVQSLNVRNGTTREIFNHVLRASLSPDRRWLAALADRPGGRAGWEWYVMDVANPGTARRIDGETHSPAELFPIWSAGRRPAETIRRIEFQSRPATIGFDSPFQLNVAGIDEEGITTTVHAPLSWRVSDTTIARVDSSGMVRPLKAGRVTVAASVAGLDDSLTLDIVESPARTVLSESWRQGIARNWIAYGDPKPHLRPWPGGGAAFDNGGDGSYSSGAFTREHWPASQGIGVEVKIVDRVTSYHWQRASIALVSGLDSAALGKWDMTTGEFPPLERQGGGRSCEFSYPGLEGPGTDSTLGASANYQTYFYHAPVSLRRGRPLRVRLQLFPDGTCGLALDGKPVWRSHIPIRRDSAIAVLLGTSSAGTDVLHGPIEVWQGVRSDVPWAALITH